MADIFTLDVELRKELDLEESKIPLSKPGQGTNRYIRIAASVLYQMCFSRPWNYASDYSRDLEKAPASSRKT